eukprot:COSAG06_NODE_34006_length_481_cov_0.764398_1_plen_122_part_01
MPRKRAAAAPPVPAAAAAKSRSGGKIARKAETSEESSESEDDDDGDGSYSVQRVVDKRTEGGKVEYRVRWEGYESEDDTWEEVGNLESAAGVVAEFERLRAIQTIRGLAELTEPDEPAAGPP